MEQSNFPTLKRRTSNDVDLKRLQITYGPTSMQYELDIKAPSQRFIFDCCQNGAIYEAVTVHSLIATLKPGDTFVDVGEHVGFFTIFAAALVGPQGRVIAFEPNAENFALLKKNLALNSYQHVHCVNWVVGDRSGEVTFFDNLDNDGGHALWDPGLHSFNVMSKARPHAHHLPMTTLDAALSILGVTAIKAVKIDTEGFYRGSVAGMTELGVLQLPQMCRNRNGHVGA